MVAARKRGGRRAPRRLAATVALALLAALTAASIASPWVADAAVSDEARVDVLAAPRASGTVLEGQPLTVRVTLSNTGSQATDSLSVELRLDGRRAVSAEELGSWFDSDARSAELGVQGVAARATVAALEPGGSAVLDLAVAARSDVWAGSFGARLAEVVVIAGDQPLAIDRTAVVWVPSGTTTAPVGTTFVRPISTPGEPNALLSPETLAVATAESGSLSRALSSSAGRPVLLAIDPRVIASIRALGDAAPPTALDFLTRLNAAPNESFLLPWADADPLASFDADEVLLPQPEGTGVLRDEAIAVNGSATPSPSDDSGDVDDGALLSTTPIADLVDWAPTLDNTVWPEPAGYTAAALDALADEGARVVITPSSALEGRDAVQRHGDLIVLRADEALSSMARAAAEASSQQQFDQAIARVSSLIAAMAANDPRAPVFITLGRTETTGADRALETIAQTLALPWTTASTVSAALTSPSAPATIVDNPSTEERRAAVVAALAAEGADRQFAQIALTPALIADNRRLELLAALSLGWGRDSVEPLRAYVDDSQRLRSSVQVAESSDILLLTDRATLPVTVQNDLDVAVRVFVRVDPDTAQLRVLDESVEALVEPRSQTRTLVPVESLTNGEVDITVTVQDAQGRALSDPTRVSLNLQAGWETAGVIVVAIAVVVLLVVGITRDLRKRRRRTMPAAPEEIAQPRGPGASEADSG